MSHRADPVSRAASIFGHRLGLVQISLGGILWGTTGVVVQWVIAGSVLGPISIGFYRLAIAAVVLLLFTAHRLGQLLRSVRKRPLPILLSGVGLGVYQVLYFIGVANAGVSISTVIALGMAPVLTATYESIRARRRPSLLTAGSVTVALVGLAVVTFAGTAASAAGPNPTLGMLASAGSGATYAATALIGRHAVQAMPALLLTTATTVVGTFTLLPLAIITGISFHPDLDTVAGLAYLGVSTTALAYGLYYAGLRTTAGSTAAVLTLLEPVTAAALAVLLLSERLSAATIIGTVLLLLSIAALYLGPAGPAVEGELILEVSPGPAAIGVATSAGLGSAVGDEGATEPGGADALTAVIGDDNLEGGR